MKTFMTAATLLLFGLAITLHFVQKVGRQIEGRFVAAKTATADPCGGSQIVAVEGTFFVGGRPFSSINSIRMIPVVPRDDRGNPVDNPVIVVLDGDEEIAIWASGSRACVDGLGMEIRKYLVSFWSPNAVRPPWPIKKK